MSFLDRLKREADQQRAQAEAVARERDERDSRYIGQIEPRMKALITYLEGLVATLREVKPPIVVAMTIQGYGNLAGLPMWDYKVEHERRYRSFVLSMQWTLRVDPERSPDVRAEGPGRIQSLTSLFRQHNLGGIKELQRSSKGDLSIAQFHARGHIKARMQAQISAEDPILRMSFENASWLGISRRQLPWDEIDDSLFDRIARFIVREDDSLFTEELPEALRQKLGREPEPARAPPAAAAKVEAPVSQPVTVAPAPRTAPPRPAPIPEKSTPAAAQSQTTTKPSVPGMIPAPAPVEAGEIIQIDESRLGLDRGPDAPIIGLDREGDFARRSPAPIKTPEAPQTPASLPPAAGDTIAMDESRLGLHGFVDSGHDSFTKVVPTSPAATPAPAATKATPPIQAVAASATVKSETSPAAPVANPQAAATAPDPAVQASAADKPAIDADQERDAALFRLRMRAMMSRLRSDEQSDEKPD